MFLLPMPKELKYYDGNFYVNRYTEIVLDYSCNLNNFEYAKLLQEETEKVTGLKVNINKSLTQPIDAIFLKIQK